MRIAVMGTGAVGGYFGARLAVASHEVIFIARGDHLNAMRLQGLTIRNSAGELSLRNCRSTDDPAQAGPVDLILFCVKSYDTDECAKQIGPLVGEKTLIVSLQNGVDNGDKLAQHWDKRLILSGVVYIGAQVVSPGIIQHSSGGRILCGPVASSSTESVRLVEDTFRSAQVPCEITAEIGRAQWTKLLWNAPFCAIACLTRATVKEIVEAESLRQLAAQCMAEVREAAGVKGIGLDPQLVIETLAFSETLGDFRPSMLQDLEANKPLEFEAFNGVVIRTLAERGKTAPVNQVFYGALKFLDERIRSRMLRRD